MTDCSINYEPGSDKSLRRRKNLRLPEYDYAQEGAYFITVCTHNKVCLFGDIVDEEMVLNDAGKIAQQCWMEIPVHFPHVTLDYFVVMPNHVHGVLFIGDEPAFVGAKNFSPSRSSTTRSTDAPYKAHGTSKTIGSIVRGFKIGVTKWIRQNSAAHTVWQRNFFERIIRNERELVEIREYVVNNPQKWAIDRENPYFDASR